MRQYLDLCEKRRFCERIPAASDAHARTLPPRFQTLAFQFHFQSSLFGQCSVLEELVVCIRQNSKKNLECTLRPDLLGLIFGEI